jgi:PhzF family phenazine biosynthesis protein
LLVPIQQIVTFATDPFRGNPAFVLTPGLVLPDPTLNRICAHLRETMIAVLQPHGEEMSVRFATPNGFHPGAGHATHAAAWVALNILRPGAASLDLTLESGQRRNVRRDGATISVDWPVMPYADTDLSLHAALGATPRETFTSSFGAIAIFEDEAAVQALSPDLAKIEALPVDTVIATAPAQGASGADFAIRVFAPRLNLPEDPVCGTAHRILVPLWAARTGRRELVSHQLSPRGGELYCRLHGDIVTIAGRAVPFLSGSIDLPA